MQYVSETVVPEDALLARMRCFGIIRQLPIESDGLLSVTYYIVDSVL